MAEDGAGQGVDAVEIDAELEDDTPRRSWGGQFVRGAIYGLALSGLGVLALFVATDPPEEKPVGRSAEVRQPVVVPAPAPAPAPAPVAAVDAGSVEAVADPVPAPAPAPASDTDTDSDTAAAPVEAEAPAEAGPAADGAADGTAAAVGAGAEEADAPAGAGAPAGGDAQSGPPAETAAEPPAAPELSGPALEINAVATDAAVTSKLLSIVLMEAGRGGVTPEQLVAMGTEINVPLTVGVQPGAEGRLLGRMAREAGHEVLAVLPTRDGAGPALRAGMPADEVRGLTDSWMAGLDMAIAATVPPGTGAAEDREVIYAALTALNAHGFAYVEDARPGVATTAADLAAGMGATYLALTEPAPGVADERLVVRALEAAARSAKRTGSAALILPGEPASLAAVQKWLIEGGRAGIQLVPLSAVIQRRGQAG